MIFTKYKRIRSLLAFIIALLMLSLVTGCLKDSGSSDISVTSLKKTDNPTVKDNKAFTETKMPDLKAEKVDYYHSLDTDYDCFMVCIDGRYGTMNDEGLTIADPIFEEPYFAINYYYEDSNPNESLFQCALWCFNGDEDEMIVFDKDGGLVPCHMIPTGYEGNAEVYWMSGKPVLNVYGDYHDYNDCSYEKYSEYKLPYEFAYMNYVSKKLSHITPIREITALNKDDEMGSYTPVYKSDKYGLFSFDTQKMITGFEFDECTVESEGVFAVRKGDKWAYITNSGKMLTGFEYDVSHVKVNEYDSSDKTNEMFLPVNGYIITVKNGKYGIIDTSGKTVAENEYDYLSQVRSDGVFWALKDGVWRKCKMN